MKKFEIGKEYFTHSVFDSGCRFTIKVTGRTEKTVSYIYEGMDRRSKIRIDADGEYVRPDNYSMAPVFRAGREAQPEEKAADTPSAQVETPNPEPSNLAIISQQLEDGTVVMIGQQVERNCGACYPITTGKIVGFVDLPKGPFRLGGVYAVVRWEDRPDQPEQVKLSQIHPQGWRSENGSPLGIFIAQ